MIRCDFIGTTIAIMLLCITQIGCVTSMPGSAGTTSQPTTPSEQICYTRAEHARIAAFKVRCKSKIKELRGELAHKGAKAKLLCEGETKKLAVRLQTCLKQAKAKHTCPSCSQPVLVAGGIGFAAGVVATIVAVAVLELNKGAKP